MKLASGVIFLSKDSLELTCRPSILLVASIIELISNLFFKAITDLESLLGHHHHN